jgi:hypothetical protein
LVDALQAVTLQVDDGLTVPRRVHADLARLRTAVDAPVPDAPLVRGLMAWTYLFGAVSFELFGQRANVVDDGAAFFEHEMRRIGAFVGLRPAVTGGRRH